MNAVIAIVRDMYYNLKNHNKTDIKHFKYIFNDHNSKNIFKGVEFDVVVRRLFTIETLLLF